MLNRLFLTHQIVEEAGEVDGRAVGCDREFKIRVLDRWYLGGGARKNEGGNEGGNEGEKERRKETEREGKEKNRDGLFRRRYTVYSV